MQLAELVWIPLYIDRLLSSPSWINMKDFQRGWYIQLLLLCVRSKRLGYLPLDGRLWEMAGAHSRPMWDSHKGAVMACFQTRTFDGTEWIYNSRLLHTIEHQKSKLEKSLELRSGRGEPSISKFLVPSLEEIRTYCLERKNNVDPEKFFAHYEANGWMAGRVPMKKWKAAVWKWEKDEHGTNRQDRPTEQHRRWVDNTKAIAVAAGSSLDEIIGNHRTGPQARSSASSGRTLEGEVRKV